MAGQRPAFGAMDADRQVWPAAIPMNGFQSVIRLRPDASPWLAADLGSIGWLHFNESLIVENFVLSVEPRPFTAAMMARLIPAAINAYSIAVAPDCSSKKRCNSCRTPGSFINCGQRRDLQRLRDRSLEP
jgi:hypothetical protein